MAYLHIIVHELSKSFARFTVRLLGFFFIFKSLLYIRDINPLHYKLQIIFSVICLFTYNFWFLSFERVLGFFFIFTLTYLLTLPLIMCGLSDIVRKLFPTPLGYGEIYSCPFIC